MAPNETGDGAAFPGQVAVGIQPDAPTPENTGAFLDQLAADAARAAMPTDEPEAPTEAETPTGRDAKGRFTAVPKPEDSTDDADATEEDAVTKALNPDGTDAPEDTDTTEGAEATEGDEESQDDTPALVLPLLDRDPMVAMTVTVGDKAVEGVPNMTIAFKANGKDRVEPLDKVVRLAVDGIYSEQREQRYRAIETEASTLKSRADQLESQLTEAQQFVDALLADEGTYLTEKDAWDRENTPEMRTRRLEQQLAEERQARELDGISQQGHKYFTQTLTPALDTISQATPFVAQEELVAKLKFEVDRLQGSRGYLVPDQYEAINRYVIDELVPWAKAINESRSSRYTPKEVAQQQAKVAADAKQEAAKATATSQKTKNQVAKGMKPVGKAQAPAPSKRPAPVNVDDAMEQATQDAVAAVLAM